MCVNDFFFVWHKKTKTKQCQFFGAKDWEENRARADGRVDDRGARCFVPQRLRVERRTVTVRRSGPHALTLENTSRWLRECPSLPRLKCSRAARPTRWRCACLSRPLTFSPSSCRVAAFGDRTLPWPCGACFLGALWWCRRSQASAVLCAHFVLSPRHRRVRAPVLVF